MARKQQGVGNTANKHPQQQQTSHNEQPVWLDGQDILLRLHISKRTLQYWRTRHIIPYNKVGKKIFYKESDVNAMIEDKRVIPTPKKGKK